MITDKRIRELAKKIKTYEVSARYYWGQAEIYQIAGDWKTRRSHLNSKARAEEAAQTATAVLVSEVEASLKEARIAGIKEAQTYLRVRSPYATDYRLNILLQRIERGEA